MKRTKKVRSLTEQESLCARASKHISLLSVTNKTTPLPTKLPENNKTNKTNQTSLAFESALITDVSDDMAVADV